MNHFLLVGLGNPGEQYAATRHNLGIRLLRAWFNQAKDEANDIKDWHTANHLHASLAQITLEDTRVSCLFPLTFMNDSGLAVRAYVKKRLSRLWQALPLEHILIMHDELELPLGAVKLKKAGSARGHNGVKSIQHSLGTQDIPRLLLGIGPVRGEKRDFVLSTFSPTEEEMIKQVTPQIMAEIKTFLNASF
ncbi:MAG TPA: aminoacyl-tRNA hydrolase [Candidatus Andersenbacteria bacterium]|nr:aminoacyl-tRNA hydrolase [Candidatus Andersenbacteria bacterium]